MIDIFTKQEKIFIIVLLGGILIGSAIEIYKNYFKRDSDEAVNQALEDFENSINVKSVLIDSILDERNKAIEPNQLFLTKVKNKASVGPKRIEINSATIEELVQLPQIGPVLANNIIAYRNTHGAFYDIEDLIKVKGIGKKKLNAIKPYIFIQQN